MTAVRAMNEFLLKPEHLIGLRVTYRRSPNELDPPIKVYWRKDVEAKSIQIWGNLEAIELEKDKRLKILQEQEEILTGNVFKRIIHRKRDRKKSLGIPYFKNPVFLEFSVIFRIELIEISRFYTSYFMF